MTLPEVRVKIDEVDSKIKELFLDRMNCSYYVAKAKEPTGQDVFVLERELDILKRRGEGVDPSVYDEYMEFLIHLMSVSRRYQYGILTGMQDKVMTAALEAAGLDGSADHSHVSISFVCNQNTGKLNLFVNMVELNKVAMEAMNMEASEAGQVITMTLAGNVNDASMRTLLCQIGKEAADFKITSLN